MKLCGKHMMLKCESLHVGHMVHMLCFTWGLGMDLNLSFMAKVKLLDWWYQKPVTSFCWMRLITVS